MTIVVTSPPGAVYKVATNGVPFITPPTGTMGNNGAYTAGTALPTTYAKGYFWFAANQIFAGSAAGWYYGQASSTTAVTVFNNTYTSGAVTVPTSPTAFVSTGPGSITGVTTTVTGPQITVPAGIIGPNGCVRTTHNWGTPNNANNKTLSYLLGGVSLFTSVVTTLLVNLIQTATFNRGSQAAQVSPPQGNSGIGTGAGGSATYSTINTAIAQTAVFTSTLAVATDFIVLESFMIEVVQG